jgi:hypothetical protein
MDIPQDPGPESLDFPMDLEPPGRPSTPTRLPIIFSSSPDQLADLMPDIRTRPRVRFAPTAERNPTGPNRSLLNSNLPQKRPTSTPEAPRPAPTQTRTPEDLCPGPTLNEFSFTAQRLAALTPRATSAEEAIAIARNMVIQASSLVSCTKKQSQLLDLLEVFRDFTENGRVNKHGLSVLASQVASLETVSRTIGTKIQQLHKPTTPTSTTPPQPTPKPPPPASTSYAATAARAQPTTSDWQQVTKKKTTAAPIKNSLSDRQLVLTLDQYAPFNSLALRNAFNQAFANKGVNSPVIASVTTSKRQNIVLTTTPNFNAKYLQENQEIWSRIVQFKDALPIQPWYKVAIHNIPTSYHTNESLAILKSEIATFNKGFQIVGNPYWLTREEKRMDQQTGSVCIAFATEQEAQRAIRNKLYLLGISVRVEKLHSTPASTQCQNCQHFGHTELRCSGSIACKICAEPHPTRLHKCNTCNTKGKACVHTVPLCINCKGPHTADSKLCDTYKATVRHTGWGGEEENPNTNAPDAGQ